MITLPSPLQNAGRTAWVYLSDVRNLGLVAFGVIVLLVSWSGVKTIQTNYELQKKIAVIEQQNEVKRLENENQKLKNAYLESNQYLELAARRQFGLAAPGEKVWVIPKEVALQYAADLPSAGAVKAEPAIVSETRGQRNFQAWIDFFLHRTRRD